MAQLKDGSTVNSNVIWHAGNDGPGSTLDADTVDGQHASAFATSSHSHAINDLSDATITTPADNELLAYDNGSGTWINQTAAEAGLSETGHAHAASDITSGTFADARIAQSNVTQHQAALTITESQISDLNHYDSADFNTDFASKSTTDLSEGTNLYHTAERVSDVVGGMVTGNTETLITVTYDDSDNTLDFVVNNDLSAYDNTTSNFQNLSEVQSEIDTRVDKAFVDALNVDADTLDGIDSTGFATSTHDHDSTYVNLTGDTMSGQLQIAMGAAPQTLQTWQTASEDFIFLRATGSAPNHKWSLVPSIGGVEQWSNAFAYDFSTNTWEADSSKVLTVADEGHGNGIDADTVDGQHASDLASATHNHDADYVNATGDTMSGTLNMGSNRVSGSILPFGSQNSVTLITGYIQNSLIDYVDRGGTVSHVLSGASVESGQLAYLYTPTDGYQTISYSIDNADATVEITFEGKALDVMANATNWRPYLLWRAGPLPAEVKVEYLDGSATPQWVEVENNLDPNFSDHVWFGTSFTANPLNGLRFTLRFVDDTGQVARIKEAGINHPNMRFGRYWIPSMLDNESISGSWTFQEELTIPEPTSATSATTKNYVDTRSINDLTDVDTVTTPPVEGDALVWDDSTSTWIPGEVAAAGDDGAFSATIGDGASTTFNINHNLTGTDINWEIWDLLSATPSWASMDPEAVYASGTGTLILAFSEPPDVDQYRVTIVSSGTPGAVSNDHTHDGLSSTQVQHDDLAGRSADDAHIQYKQMVYELAAGNWTGDFAVYGINPSNLYSVIWANKINSGVGNFVAASNSRFTTRKNIIHSRDGKQWDAINANPESRWRSISWSPELGIFAVVGNSQITPDSKQVMTSSDGDTWTAQDVFFDGRNWNDVVWSPGVGSTPEGKFVAVGDGTLGLGKVMTSPNGVDWTIRTSADDNSIWQAVEWSQDLELFVAVSRNNTRVMTSPDGITWTSRTAAEDNSWQDVAWSPDLGLFAAVSSNGNNRVMTSPDGINWSSQSEAHDDIWGSIAWSPGTAATPEGSFVAVATSGSTSRIMRSTDGINWSTISAPSSDSQRWEDIVWSDDLELFVASGFGYVMYSSDGKNWTEVAFEDGTDGAHIWYGIAWSSALGELCIIDGRETNLELVATSTDAITWDVKPTIQVTGWELLAYSSELNIVCAVAPNFRATEGQNVITIDNNLRAKYQDAPLESWSGLIWSSGTGATPQGQFVAVGGGSTYRSMTSPDGVTWTPSTSLTSGSHSWEDLAWSSDLDLYCAIEASGHSATSSDGDTWVIHENVFSGVTGWNAITWSSKLGVFCAVAWSASDRRQIALSSDGSSWTLYDSPFSPGEYIPDWFDVVWADEIEMFIAVSGFTNDYIGAQETVMTSFDGQNWSIHHGAPGYWRSIAWSPKRKIFVSVSESTFTDTDGTEYVSAMQSMQFPIQVPVGEL